ncbi:MAG TPA: hypothetical protein VGI84_01190 [Pseudonocardiaceae bacterium]|jgi:hypothetical protein
MSSLISAQLGHLLALRRVCRGHVILVGDDLFLDRGARIPGHLHDSLHDLLGRGHLSLGSSSAECDQRPVLVTPSGVRLHRTLESAGG